MTTFTYHSSSKLFYAFNYKIKQIVKEKHALCCISRRELTSVETKLLDTVDKNMFFMNTICTGTIFNLCIPNKDLAKPHF